MKYIEVGSLIFDNPSLFFMFQSYVLNSYVKAKLRNIGRKKRKLQNEEESETSSSGVSFLMVVMDSW